MNLAAGPSLQTRSLESEMLMERAQKVGAQEFHGTPDPSVADDWFQRMEGVFEVIQCSDEEKLKVATFMLGGEARDWWKSIRARQPRGTKLIWEDFKKEFVIQYYPDVYIDERRREFLRINQGRRSVAEYEATFTRLSQFAEGYMRREKERCRLFLDGLKLEIKSKVGTQHYNGYAELVQLAMRVEMYKNKYISRRQERTQQNVPNVPFGGPRQGPFRRGQYSGSSSSSYRSSNSSSRGASSMSASSPLGRPTPYTRPPSAAGSRTEGMGKNFNRPHNAGRGIPQYNIYGKSHPEKYRFEEQGCFHCGQLGHFKKKCPRLGQQRGGF